MLKLVEASRQHRCTGDQHYRERRLHYQQPFAGKRGMIARTAARSAQGFRGVGTRGKPRRSRTKDDARHQRQSEGKRHDHERWHGPDGKEMRAVERQRQQQPRGSHGHHKPDHAAARRQEDALREGLRNNLPPRRADGQPDGGLPTTRHRTSQEKVSHIGAGNQEH